MRITNTLPFSTESLRRMAVWVCRQIPGMSTRELRIAFATSRANWSGRAYSGTRIAVRLGRNIKYPQSHNRFGVEHNWIDDWEVLVAITAHEAAHAGDWRDGCRTNERSADRQMQQVVDAFRRDRERLLAHWLQPPAEKPAKARPSIQERRAAKVAKHLANWQRKLRLAQSKVRAYKRKAAYYEKVAAIKSDTKTQHTT